MLRVPAGLLSLFGMTGLESISAGERMSSVPTVETIRHRRVKGMMKKQSRRDAQVRRRNRRRMAKMSRRKNYQVLGRRG